MSNTAVAKYDPFDADFLHNPYPAYAYLREHDPVHLFEGSGDQPTFYAISRFGDIDNCVKNTDIFSSAHGLTMFADEIEQLGLAPTIVMMDPPQHTGKRRLLAKAFSPRTVSRCETHIREFASSKAQLVAEKVKAGQSVDLHTEYSSTIPTYVLAHLFNLPDEDHALLDPWVNALVSIANDGFAISGLGTHAVTAVGEMFEYFGQLVKQRRELIDAGHNPGEDLISELIRAEIEGEKLDDWDILGFCFVIVAGGNDTTGNLISHTAMLLDQHPSQREEMLARPQLIPGALTECLRLESSVQGLARFTTQDIRLYGTTIPSGSKVMMLYGSGNRDEREFGPTAHQLDIHRRFSRHLAFAQGPHFCIGSHFAKLQAKIAVEEMYARLPHLAVNLEKAERIHSPFTRGFLSLPVDADRTLRA